MEQSLTKKALKGVFWNFIQRFGVLGISFVTNIVLARLLLPSDFGCIGLLLVFIGLSGVIVEGGLTSALIQKKETTIDDYSTVFVWNLSFSILLYLLIFLSSKAIENFYNIEDFSFILRVQAIIIIINALYDVLVKYHIKNLNFKLLTQISIISSIISSIIGVILAYKGFGVWALVLKNISYSVLYAIILWYFTSFRPQFVFKFYIFKEMFGFSFMLFLSNFTESIVFHFQSILIGKFFSPAQLGYYTQSKTLFDIPQQTIPIVVDQVAFPLYSSIQDDKERISGALKKSLNLICFVTFPLMLFLCIAGEEIITFLFSDKWLPSVVFFQILCIGGILFGINSNNVNVVKSVGKTNYIFISSLLKRLSTIILILLGMYTYGLNGLVIGYTLSMYSWVPINTYFTKKVIGITLLDQIKEILPIFLITILTSAITYIVFNYMLPKFAYSIVSIMLQGLFFVILYLLTSWVTKSKSLKLIFELLNNIKK